MWCPNSGSGRVISGHPDLRCIAVPRPMERTGFRENGYRYLVEDRERHRRFDPDTAVAFRTRSEQTLRL